MARVAPVLRMPLGGHEGLAGCYNEGHLRGDDGISRDYGNRGRYRMDVAAVMTHD